METFYYDEVIELKNLKENKEIEKYYIPTELSEIEKVNFISKKGYLIQKMAMINRIPEMVKHRELIEHTFQLILEYIEIWDDSLQIALANSIVNCYNPNLILDKFKTCESFPNEDEEALTLIYTNTLNVVNLLIKFCMKIISTEVNNISGEFLKALSTMVKFYSVFRKIKVENDAIDFACNMGSFGKNVASRRYSVYFCSCLIQISENFHQELYARYMILSSDCERCIKLEVAYNLRFLMQEYLEEKFIKQNFIKLVDNFLTEDDFFIKSETIISVLLTIRKFNDETFLQSFCQKLLGSFDNINISDFGYYFKVFDCIVSEYEILNQVSKSFYTVIKLFLKKYINKDVTGNNLNPSQFKTIIENFPQLVSIFKINKENLLTVEVLNFIFKNFASFQILFLENFHNIIKSIPREDSASVKLLASKFSTILDEKDTKEGKINFPILVRNMKYILPAIQNIEDFVLILITKFYKFEEYIQDSVLKNGWYETTKILSSFSKCEPIFSNKEFTVKIYAFLMTLIKEEAIDNLHVNYKIVKSSLKVLPLIIKYSQKGIREEILKFIEKEIVDSKSFYKRRLFFPFFKKSLKIFSINFLKENSILNNFIKLLGDNTLIIRILISEIKNFYPLIAEDSKLKSAVISKLDSIRKSKIDDTEIIQALKEFDEWHSHYNKYSEAPEFTSLLNEDAEKMKKEKTLIKKDLISSSSDKKEERGKAKKVATKKSTHMIKNSIDLKKNILRETNQSSTVKKSPNNISRGGFRSVDRKYFKGKDILSELNKVTPAKSDYSSEKAKISFNVNNVRTIVTNLSAKDNLNIQTINKKKIK